MPGSPSRISPIFRRSAGSASRARIASGPPSCTALGSRLTATELPEGYGYTSNVMSSPSARAGSIRVMMRSIRPAVSAAVR